MYQLHPPYRMKTICQDGVTYQIGTNAQENTDLIRAAQEDWSWFHLEKFPSCHVIVCATDVTEPMIQTACTLVKTNSKYKFKHIGIVYCKIGNLTHGDEPGSVLFKRKRQVNTVHL